MQLFCGLKHICKDIKLKWAGSIVVVVIKLKPVNTSVYCILDSVLVGGDIGGISNSGSGGVINIFVCHIVGEDISSGDTGLRRHGGRRRT